MNGIFFYWDQSLLFHEYSTYPATIPGYEHNYVLQKSFTHIFGDEIPAAEIVTDGIYTRDFNVAVPANVENNANLSLVAFVMGNENNEVINAQTVRVGQNQEFDQVLIYYGVSPPTAEFSFLQRIQFVNGSRRGWAIPGCGPAKMVLRRKYAEPIR